MRYTVLLLAPFLLFGCNKEPEGPDNTLRNAYLESLCRFYTDETCVDNQLDSCGGVLSFDSSDECQQFLRFALAGCDDYVDVLNDNESTVQGCIDDMDAFDCDNDEFCDATSGDDIFDAGDCLATDELIQATCPDDTGF